MKLSQLNKKIMFMSMFILPLTANSAIVDLGNITRDTGTGLDWLDVTMTTGLTINEVFAQMGSGGTYEGWRYATVTELDQLVTNFGFIPNTPCTSGYTNCVSSQPGDDPIIETMIRTLGDTYAQEFPQLDYSNGAGETFGYVRDNISYNVINGSNPNNSYSVAFFEDYEYIDYCQSAGCPRVVDLNDWVVLNGGASGNRIGSFLVTASPVPVPATVWLFGSGLMGLIGISKRKKSV